MPKKQPKASPQMFIISVVVLCSLAMIFLTLRLQETGSSRFIFLYWNLLLAGVAPIMAYWLVSRVRRFGWLKWQQIVLLLLWLSFLPNSFYILTDFVHLRQTFEVSLIYDIVLILSFTLCGLILGFTSVYIVHRELIKKINPRRAWYAVSGVFFLSSFAIYLGRYSRWNTWDIVLTPAGLLFDVSDRVVNPAAHTETYTATATVFVLLLVAYWVVWEASEFLRAR